jgi:hypothetical protein
VNAGTEDAEKRNPRAQTGVCATGNAEKKEKRKAAQGSLDYARDDNSDFRRGSQLERRELGLLEAKNERRES